MTRRSLALSCSLLLVAGLTGCTFELDVCEQDSDCGQRQRCDDGVCKDRPRVEVTDNIGEDTTWTADKIWVLNDVITVQPAVTLTIEPGTLVLGRQYSALVVRRGGWLVADGTRDQPIVFTSYAEEGQRLPGDWGGVALLGHAPVNRVGAYLRIKPGELEPLFGGEQDDWSCGTLRYVRIEFGGGRITGEEYLNSLSMCGCGTGTVMDHVQLHFGGDDGLEIFGGTMDFRHLVVTRAQDDGLDIDLGWVGTGQFVAIQLDTGAENAVEIDNLKEDATALPLTDFEIYNITMIGSPDSEMQRGITFKNGAGGFFSHGIMMQEGLEAIDVYGLEAGARALAGECVVENTLFYQIGAGGEAYFPVAGTEGEDDGSGDDDGGFPEDEFYTDPAQNNVFGEDPDIESPYDITGPTWVPRSSVVTGVPAPPAPFDQTANYLGAFAPDTIPWTEGWTDYPTS